MKKMSVLICMIVVWGMASTCFALNPILIGNFEDPISGGRYDNWLTDYTVEPVTDPCIAATLDTHSLQCVDDDGGWGATITKPLGEYGSTPETNPLAAALLNEGSLLSIDVTAFPGEVAEDWATLELFASADGYWGAFAGTDQGVTIDGQPHTYEFFITGDIRDVITNGIAGWGCNLGWLLNTGAASTTIYIDNIWIYPEVPEDPLLPHNGETVQALDLINGDVDVTLTWEAAADPNEDVTGYAVNPDIVDQYIFLGVGEPNMVYIGATGTDPGVTDPCSQYGPIDLPLATTYTWAVVDAIEGNEQSFTVGLSTLGDVDPNNLIGPVWTFETLSDLPEITTQPVNARVALGGNADPAFTVVVSSYSEESYQWYYSTDAVIDSGDTLLSGETSDELSILGAILGDEGFYYCEVINNSAIPVYTDVVSLVVERIVAQYQFENDLTDSISTNHGTGYNSPVFVTDCVEGTYAIALDGINQYVDLGSSAYPQAGFGIGGIGGGLDVGTVMCWVKLDAIAAASSATILSNQNPGWPVTWFGFEIASDETGANANQQTFVWGDDAMVFWATWNPPWADPFNMAGDGQWHMLATTWDMNGTVKTYMDGNLLGAFGATASTFSAWVNGTVIGATRGEPFTNYFDGLIDNLRVCNYEVAAEDIVQEYYDITSNPGCIYDFAGSNFNGNQLGSSYCKIDLADFAEFASNWLNDGFYTPAP
ncbi:MAG: hypothetical protein JW860_13005 [Sedimentisphaerales bacterium]|nr:hypothetical protein [Sedimentisphaerales bacterium]